MLFSHIYLKNTTEYSRVSVLYNRGMAEKVNPDDFIITRKRKKYRFAKFHNAENCFEFDEWDKRQVDVVEVGAGTGLFALELAARHPERVYAAVDVKADRLQKGAYAALDRGIKNIVFIRARADQVDELFAPHSLAQIWVTFADPFPKSKKGGRRMTHPTYLRKYAGLLRQSDSPSAKGRTLDRGDFVQEYARGLFVKHDNVDFFHWSLEQLVVENWHIDELSFDLHESDLADDYKILTTYEARWLSEGRVTSFVLATTPT